MNTYYDDHYCYSDYGDDSSFSDKVEAHLEKRWEEENPREADILNYATKHRKKWAIIKKLAEMRDNYIKENYDDEAHEWADEAAEAADPYGYRGLRRSDFF